MLPKLFYFLLKEKLNLESKINKIDLENNLIFVEFENGQEVWFEISAKKSTQTKPRTSDLLKIT